MEPDPIALHLAHQALDRLLHDEAQQQNSYVRRFPDGRVSMELEWIDLAAIARGVVAAYLSASGAASASAPRTVGCKNAPVSATS